MNVIIMSSHIQFKNPKVGQPTRAVEEHYNGRRVFANIGGEEELIRFKKDEMPFNIDEDEMIELIKQKLDEKEVEIE